VVLVWLRGYGAELSCVPSPGLRKSAIRPTGSSPDISSPSAGGSEGGEIEEDAEGNGGVTPRRGAPAAGLAAGSLGREAE
jgi:hypothetical protein